MSNQVEPPLTETVFYILLAVKTPLRGYGIIQEVEKLTDNRISLGPGTLYGAIKSLLNKGLIELVHEDQRKKEYQLTGEGLDVLKQEVGRLEELLRNGKRILGGEER